jgi:hypothetical protein
MTRLVDLEPRRYTLSEDGPAAGISFLCPHCHTVRLGVLLHHRGHEAMEDEYIRAHNPEGRPIWTADGDDFETLTLSPSVDASHVGHWHGFIRNGQAE